jgi:uncharacterized protein (TIGR02996 family)
MSSPYTSVESAQRPQLLAFLADIKDHVEDDAPRLILADWLEDNGQEARAEFIRLQCQLAHLAEDDRERPKLLKREIELVNLHEEFWVRSVRTRARRWRFQRGLLRIETDAFIFLHAPWPLLHAEALDWIEAVHLTTGMRRGRDEILRLVESTILPQLTALDLSAARLGLPGAEGIARAPHLGRLNRLRLAGNELNDEAASILARTAPLARLTDLDLSGNLITDVGAAALAHSPHLNRLTNLEIGANAVSPAGEAALRRRFGRAVHVVPLIASGAP